MLIEWRIRNGLAPASPIVSEQQLAFTKDLVQGSHGVLNQPTDMQIRRFNEAVLRGGNADVRAEQQAWRSEVGPRRRYQSRMRAGFVRLPANEIEIVLRGGKSATSSMFGRNHAGSIGLRGELTLGGALLVADAHLQSRVTSDEFGLATEDIASSSIVIIGQMLDPIHAISDPINHLQLFASPIRTIEQGNQQIADTFMHGIVVESHQHLIYDANHPDLNAARKKIADRLQAIEALQNGRDMSRTQLKNQIQSVLRAHRQ